MNEVIRVQADLEAAYEAEKAYRGGAWLRFAVASEPSETQTVMLGGEFDDRALNDLGYNGTVAASGTELFEPQDIARSVHRLQSGEPPNEAEQRRNDLFYRSQFYTSPVVREPERVTSNVPVEVPDNPANAVWTYPGNPELLAHTFGDEWHELDGGVEVAFDGYGSGYFSMTIPEGKRLVIDHIPKGSKHDDPDEPTTLGQIHIYPNSKGFLVADKAMNGLVVGKKRPVNLKPAAEGTIQIDQDAVPAQQDLWATNDKKQEFRHPLEQGKKTVQLLATTATWVVERGGYDTSEFTISTPDDSGMRVDVEMRGGSTFKRPVVFRLVDNNHEELHPLFQ